MITIYEKDTKDWLEYIFFEPYYPAESISFGIKCLSRNSNEKEDIRIMFKNSKELKNMFKNAIKKIEREEKEWRKFKNLKNGQHHL